MMRLAPSNEDRNETAGAERLESLPSVLDRVAVIDDWQGVAAESTDWRQLEERSEVVFFQKPFLGESDAAAQLQNFNVVLSMRERTRFPSSLLRALPHLKMLGITGPIGEFVDLETCSARNILVCGTDYPRQTSVAASELALGLMLAVARSISAADANMRRGLFQEGLPVGVGLEGKVLGILGLGHLGSRMAQSGKALGMKVQAWSENLAVEEADMQGVSYVSKDELFSASDVISVHLRLSKRTAGSVGGSELSKMKKGAILINTSRGPIVNEEGLLAALTAGKISAGLDVFDQEPLPPKHPLRSLPNVVLTPHLGYGIGESWSVFYGQSAENALAFLNGAPVRCLNAVS